MTETVGAQGQKPYEIDERTSLPVGLHSGNAEEYVPVPPAHKWSIVDGMADDTRITATGDDYGEGIEITMAYGTPGEPRSILLEAHINIQDLIELYEKVIAPQLARRKEVQGLSDAAYAQEKADREQWEREVQQRIDASAFRLQGKRGNSGFNDRMGEYHRLHRHTCPVLVAAGNDGIAVTLEELVTGKLAVTRAVYDTLLDPSKIESNRRARQRRHALDNSVLSVCGRCKPMGERSKDVSEALYRLAHLTAPEAMEKLVNLLVEIEQGAQKTEAEFQQRVLNEEPW